MKTMAKAAKKWADWILRTQPSTKGNKLMLFLFLLIFKATLILILIPFFSKIYPTLYAINHFPDGYDKIATNLIEARGYRFFPDTSETLMRPPGLVLLLAAIFYLFGKNLIVVQSLNILFTFATAYIVLLIGQRIMANSMAPYFAALLFLFHPGIILAESRGGVESLFTFLMTASLLLLYRAIDTNRSRYYIISGSVLGLSIIVKSTPMIIPAFVFIYLLFTQFRKIGLKSICLNVSLMILPILIVLSPWIVRNYSITGKFVPTMTVLGSTAYQGLYVNENFFTGKQHYELLGEATSELNSLAKEQGLSFRSGFFQHFYDAKDEVYFNEYVFDLVKQDYLNSPALLIKNCLLNFFRFWFQGRTSLSTYMNIAITLPFLIIVAVGTYRGLKNQLNIGLIILFICVFIFGHLPILGVARYHIPLVPLLALLACISLHPSTKNSYVVANKPKPYTTSTFK